MKTIEDAVAEVLSLSRGRFRFVLNVDGLDFYSEPRYKENFIDEWETMAGHVDLSRVQYESKTEYRPGFYIWMTF
jgi:hypothetical protein